MSEPVQPLHPIPGPRETEQRNGLTPPVCLAVSSTATPLSSLKAPRVDAAPVVESPYQRRDSDRYCGLCAAWFNNPLMAQQHYDGKKHKKNAARVALLEQLGTSLDMGELRGECPALTVCRPPLGKACTFTSGMMIALVSIIKENMRSLQKKGRKRK